VIKQEMNKKPVDSAAVVSELRVHSVPTVAGEVDAEVKTASGEISLGPGLQRLVDLAMQDLGTSRGVGQAEIEILQAEYVTWRDASIGCPRQGYQYMQVLTHGARIKLRVNMQLFQYHSGGNRPPFLCAKPSATEPLPYAPGET
jgi:hypothetical protein